MSRPTSPSYKTRNWPACNEALKRRGSLTIWFDPEMSWDAAPTGRPGRQRTCSVTADGACDTRKCHDAIADRGAHAVIPPRRSAKPWKTVTAGAMARTEAPRSSKNLGRALWRRWSGHHRRSRVETKRHCAKLLGQRPMARDVDHQVAGLQLRIAVLNGYTALGIPVTEAVGQVSPGKGQPRPSADFCNRA
ncbi:MAG: transposase [Pseudomonadota bacterium]